MNRPELRFLITACALAFAAHGAAAQTPSPMKAGLWQVHIERQENGQDMPDPSERMRERMKTMTPEQRQRIEEMMKKQGVAPGAGGVTKLCYSQKMVERGDWSDQSSCKTAYSSRTATSWKWHSSCPAAGYEGDGEASFSDPEHFTVTSSGVSTIEGKERTTKFTRTGKWLGADCGDLKPMDSK